MIKKEGLWAQTFQLNFSSQQLQQLNVYFSDLEINQDLKNNCFFQWIEGEIDKLIQYLCQVVGNLDSRFNSEFLIRLKPSKNGKNGNGFSYLIRLDSLSAPSSLHCNQHETVDISLEFDVDKVADGFTMIKLEGDNVKHWQSFTNECGYLKRDAIQKRYIELLEEATIPKIDNSQSVIKKVNSHISPGKIVDAETLYYIHSISPNERIFYGYANDGKKYDTPDIRKFRIEVIESNNLLRMRIGFLSANAILDEDIDVILILGIGLQGWPSSADYPERIPFTNCDVLLHHQISTTGFFLITANPFTLVDCKNRSLLWQFYLPTADCMLMNHYSESSCFIRVFNVIYAVILNLRRTTTGGHTIGKYLLKNFLWFQLEIFNDSKYWTSESLSFHVIFILDKLVKSLRSHKYRSYFFKGYNALTYAFRNCFSQHTSRDYKEDADIIETFINRIYALSSSELIGHQSVNGENLRNRLLAHESLLMRKWNNLLMNMAFNRKHEKTIGFVSKQLEYIVFLFRVVLLTKSLSIPAHNRCVNSLYTAVDLCDRILSTRMDCENTISIEEVLFILHAILEQAKRCYLISLATKSNMYDYVVYCRTSHSDFETNLQICYDEEVTMIIERVINGSTVIFHDDIQAAKFALNVLFQSITTSKIVRKILKPYLKFFYKSTQENCWHLEEWKNRVYNEELVALRIFSKLVSEKKVKFKIGLLDAFHKGWDWARELLKLSVNMRNGQDLLFNSSNGQITRRYLILTDDEIERFRNIFQSGSTIFRNEYADAIIELNGLYDLGKEGILKQLEGFLKILGTLKLDEKLNENCWDDSDETPINVKLRECSPMTRTINRNRRRGIHVGLGSITMALVVLGKFTTLQEITETLPEDKRRRALEIIRRATKEKQRCDRIRAKLRDKEESYRSLPEYYYLALKKDNEDVIDPSKIEERNTDSISYCNYGNYFSTKDDGSHSSGFVSFDTCSASSIGGIKIGSRDLTVSTTTANDTVMLHNPAIYYEPVAYFQGVGSLSWRNTLEKIPKSSSSLIMTNSSKS